jgi:precorrin-2 dehydrogenase/sirohydrochlorin ferrochelatase
MLPLMVDVSTTSIVVVGDGFAAAQRLNILRTAGAGNVTTFAAEPEADVIALSDDQLVRRLPTEKDFNSLNPRVVYICDIPEPEMRDAVAWAHAVRALVNVHDRQDLCDFHMPAILRRGNLQVTVSTDGKVAGLSRLLRDYLRDRVIGTEWADRVSELGQKRADWVAQKLPFEDLRDRVNDYVKERGWLD